MKIGMHVATVRACGALAENGSVDLAEGTKGVLLSIDGDTAKVELCGEDAGTVYVALDTLKGLRGRPRHVEGA
jgi:hypothetical protein